MKDIPILMSDQMILAYKAGMETMTRRVINPKPECDISGAYFDAYAGGPQWNWWAPDNRQCNAHGFWNCPYGVPGDHLWFKEAWRAASYFDRNKPSEIEDEHPIQYRADMEDNGYMPHSWGRWRPSIFMPRRFARFTPKILNIRAERLQDISKDDALKEGVTGEVQILPDMIYDGPVAAIYNFANLWDSINAKRGYPWESNPWVWVIEFERYTNDQSTAT